MEKYAIIVAGGKGTRMGSELPKQFIEIHECPILVHTIRAFVDVDPATKIILVLPEDQIDRWSEMAEKFDLQSVETAIGGDTRYQSVKNGLGLIANNETIVAVHDAVRPCIDPNLINQTFEVAQNSGNAVVCVPSKDSLRKKMGDQTQSVDRTDYFLVQTPQVFRYDLLKAAYAQPYQTHFTDDASVVESLGVEIQVVLGDYRNIKITTPEDLLIASQYLDKK